MTGRANEANESRQESPTRDMKLWHRYVSRFSEDAPCKLIFDHIRNLGICAVVGAAAGWKYRNAAPGLMAYFDFAIAGLLAALFLWLFLVNQSHLIKRMHKAGVDSLVVQFFGQIYSLVAVSIIVSLIATR
jgi:hypothetical protein